MVLMIGFFQDEQISERLHQEVASHGLAYLAYLFVPSRGQEGLFLEAGAPTSRSRQTLVTSLGAGRAELQWESAQPYDSRCARLLLEELAGVETAALSQHLHTTVCQSLTACHLHLELGLMSQPEAREEFEVARQLVQEATVSLRELIDELAGESP